MEERSGPLGQPYSRDELWAESHHVGLALENGPIDRLRRDVDRLAVEIGPRNIYHFEALQKAGDHLETSLREAGYSPLLHRYETQGKAFFNISAELPGRELKDEIIVIGAHYDTHKDSPGANDNGSAIAALLELARHFVGRPMGRTLRFVAFTMKRARSLVVKLWGAVSMPANPGDVETTSSA